jgi:hypothetical protein
MNKLKMFAVTTLAAAAIGVGGLVASPSASAMPMSCDRALALAQAYIVIGIMLYKGGYYAEAAYFGRATGVVDAAADRETALPAPGMAPAVTDRSPREVPA